MKKIVCFFLFLGSLNALSAQDFPEVMNIAKRRVLWLVSSLVIQQKSSISEQDQFELYMYKGKLYITASNANAAAMGLGWYLKYYCHRSMSHLGDNLSAPDSIPTIKEKITITSPFKYRYALNYCTVSYSMNNYTWTDWERELDWMALNGVNLLLVPVGMEAVWQNTLMKLGYTREETFQFIAHPTFSAWWLMGNLEGWGGTLSQAVIEQQKVLQRKIIKRMGLLEIQPVMQGFYGIIPTSLKNKIKIDVVPQGQWAGGFVRPDFLNPSDSTFSKIAIIYYDEMKKLYGKKLRYFGGDPFHEGGYSGNIDVAAASNTIQKQMHQAFPGSVWVLQGWQSNPGTQLLSGLDKSHALVIELFGENTNNWERRNGYENTPFVWCNVSNFGEKSGLYGKLERFADEVHRASKSKYAELLQGIGIIPEGIYNNPVVYDLMLELGWHSGKTDVNRWIKNYQLYRYGKTDAVMEKAWDIFLKTIYSSPDIPQEGAPESIFCARPSTSIGSVSTWGTRKRNYNTALFKEGVKLFVTLEEKYKNSETYQIDKTDMLRQVLANKGDSLYQLTINAIVGKNIPQFKHHSQQFLRMIRMQDSLVSAIPPFRLSFWLKKANSFGQTKADKQQAVRNTKMQYTIWGPDTNPKTSLHEYAHKEWNGILGTLYYDRWKIFVDEQTAVLEGKNPQPTDYFSVEKRWIESASIPKDIKLTNNQIRDLTERILSL